MFLKNAPKITLLNFWKDVEDRTVDDLLERKKRKAKFISIIVYTLIILITIALMMILFNILIKVNIY